MQYMDVCRAAPVRSNFLMMCDYTVCRSTTTDNNGNDNNGNDKWYITFPSANNHCFPRLKHQNYFCQTGRLGCTD